MANPKRRHSRTRQAKRRGQDKITQTGGLIACSQCRRPKKRHRICPHCGYYKGRQIREIKVKEKKTA